MSTPTFSKQFVACFKWAVAPGNCPDTLLPDAFRIAVEKPDQATELLSSYLTATFCAENIPDLEMLLASTDDVEGEEVTVSAARFDGQNTPAIKAEAVFTLPFLTDVDEDEIENWEEEVDDSLATCVTFGWAFSSDDPPWDGWLLEHESSSMQLVDEHQDLERDDEEGVEVDDEDDELDFDDDDHDE